VFAGGTGARRSTIGFSMRFRISARLWCFHARLSHKAPTVGQRHPMAPHFCQENGTASVMVVPEGAFLPRFRARTPLCDSLTREQHSGVYPPIVGASRPEHVNDAIAEPDVAASRSSAWRSR
jgi:hypothetical protein